ncbi:hypothetical protein IR010_19710 [Flavobacterium sp. MR2016-29]|uniref:hypothetical protein n=1 Tax=Flavobacterium sp. MR2016-29 TaxID=2783795 RepID=UPI000492EE02|nr:hypothetical protein [Flavobacterium sp. MR2016-29]MBF4494775.1 hypothetical protein [Flavobacterium sp. MR2016-29]
MDSINNFSLEFELNVVEIRKLNKMYFKNLYKERVSIFFSLLLFFSIVYDFFNLTTGNDFTIWIIRNLFVIIFFLIFQYSLVNTICRLIFRLLKKISKFESIIGKYKLNFNNTVINVHSPLGEITHKWIKIEKAILTKDFFFLYVKERNGYIISISNKYNDERNMEKLLTFVESNVTPIIKV